MGAVVLVQGNLSLLSSPVRAVAELTAGAATGLKALLGCACLRGWCGARGDAGRTSLAVRVEAEAQPAARRRERRTNSTEGLSSPPDGTARTTPIGKP
jgi:hypothetical protein